jgi:hypothetical protein
VFDFNNRVIFNQLGIINGASYMKIKKGVTVITYEKAEAQQGFP